MLFKFKYKQMNLLKQIPYLIIAFLIIVIFFKDCSKGGGSKPKIDTVTVTKIDTVFIKVKGEAVSNPKVITVTDTINHYITLSDSCKRPHLNDVGIELIKHRTYKDTKQIEGYFVGYEANVIGELTGIKLSLEGNVPTIKQSTVRTVTNTVEKYHSLSAYFNYNRSAQVGLMYSDKRLGYSLNYDLEYKSIGVQLSYTPFRW